MNKNRDTLLIQAKKLWAQLKEDEKRKIMEDILRERENKEENT